MLFLKTEVKHSYPYSILLILLFTVTFISCNSATTNTGTASPSNNLSTDTTEQRMVVKAGFNGTLHNVYMSKTQFEQLFNTLPASYNRMVVQFYYPSNASSFDNSPTLAAWASKKNGSGLDYFSTPLIMNYASVGFVNLPENIFFGDQQFDKKMISDAISSNAKCQDKCVFVFTPVSDAHLYYNVFMVDDSTTIPLQSLNKDTFTGITPIGKTNPSPPATAQ